MISRLKIERFKCFNEQWIDFNHLTLLTGTNATGKSTVIQALLLLRQAYQGTHLEKGELPLNGPLVSIGTAQDAFYSGPGSAEHSISFTLVEFDQDEPLTWKFDYPRGKPDQHILQAIQTSAPPAPLSLFAPQFTYLSAERLGPRLHYPIFGRSREEMDVGIQGEYTFHCLDEFGTEAIGIPALAYPNTNGRTLLQQTKLWMQPIVPNLEIETALLARAGIVRGGLKNHGTSTDYLRPTNVGFGTSYTLPIIVAALMAKPNTMLIVENPEAHLHPSAQSRLGQFLARAAAVGIQVIIETHSDHILNGIRIAVKRGILPAEETTIQFFTSGKGRVGHTVVALQIDGDGRIGVWPRNFFDQAERDLLELF